MNRWESTLRFALVDRVESCLANLINTTLAPLRQTRAVYTADTAELDRILARGAEQAAAFAESTLHLVRTAMRLI